MSHFSALPKTLSLPRFSRAWILGMAVLTLAFRPTMAKAATYVVTNNASSGEGTLAAAITSAIADNKADPTHNGDATINFDLAPGNRTIILASPLPELTTNIGIVGPTTGGGVTIARSSASGTPNFRIFSVNTAAVSLFNLTITGGSVPDGSGGGLKNLLGTLYIENCTISNNSAKNGAGIYSSTNSQYTNTTTLRNCTVTGNTASVAGGGLQNDNGKTIIFSSTIVKNSALASSGDAGGGIFHEGVNSVTRTDVGNDIIVGNLTPNTTSTNSDVTVHVTAVTDFIPENNNLIGNTSVDFGVPTGWTYATAKLSDLADNGGPTQTFALQVGSPAIDVGGGTNDMTDQRGVSRPQGSQADIGAFELVPDTSSPTVTFTTPTQNQNLSIPAFTNIGGNATDNIGVTQVQIKLFRTRAGVTTFWNGTSFGSAQALLTVNLTSAGATNTAWSYPVSSALRSALDTGAYNIAVYGRDATGNVSNAIGRAFTLITDSTAPIAIISTPRPTQNLPVLTFTSVTGTATDAVGVTQVLVKFFRFRDGAYRFWDGTTFGTTQVQLPANVNSPGSTYTTWTFPVTSTLAASLDDGDYNIAVYAKDASGNVSNAVGCNFALHSDTTVPTGNISTPVQNQTLNIAAFSSVTGTASDNVGASQAFIKLFRTRGGVSSFWDGTSFGAAQFLVPVTLATPGAASSTWSYAVPSKLTAALDNGAYTVVVYVRDAVGNQSAAVGHNFTITGVGPVTNGFGSAPAS